MKEHFEVLYEMWFDGWKQANLFGKILMCISLPLYFWFCVCVLVIFFVGPRIADAFLWFLSLMKK